MHNPHIDLDTFDHLLATVARATTAELCAEAHDLIQREAMPHEAASFGELIERLTWLEAEADIAGTPLPWEHLN